MYKIKRYEWMATQGLVYSCLVEIMKLKYPEYSTAYILFVAVLIFFAIHGLMYLFCKNDDK